MRHLQQTIQAHGVSSPKVRSFLCCLKKLESEGKLLRYFLPVLWVVVFLLFAHASFLQASEICVKDDRSRDVCVSEPVKKIISLAPGATELVYAAGAGKHVIAVDEHSDYPPAVSSVPRIGGFPNISVEAIAAMKPDMIVAWGGGNSPKVTSRLESLGIKLFYIDPLTFPDIASAIRRLGKLFGTASHANQQAEEMLARYETLKKQYHAKKPVTVFYEIWNKPLMSISRNQIIGQVIELCGGQNIYADSTIRVPKVSMESLLGRNPQVIVSSNNLKDGKTIEERWAKWSNLQAVKNHHLFTVSGNQISRPTPRALDAAETLCQQLESVRKESLAKASNAKSAKNAPDITHKE